MVVKTIIQLAFVAINYAIAVYQAHRFDIEQKRIKHWLWAIWYGLIVAASWPIHHNLCVLASISNMHLFLFNTLLNFHRTPRRALFYTHPEDPHGSIIDKVWADAYPFVFFVSLIFFIILNFFIYGSS